MKVTRDVIVDLWPLYVSREASDDTRRLVEEFLDSDQEFAKLISSSEGDCLREVALPPLREDLEVATIRKTKFLLRLRDYLLCTAVLLTFNPLTIYQAAWGNGWGVGNHPTLAVGFALSVASTWCAYFAVRRRLSATGL